MLVGHYGITKKAKSYTCSFSSNSSNSNNSNSSHIHNNTITTIIITTYSTLDLPSQLLRTIDMYQDIS